MRCRSALVVVPLALVALSACGSSTASKPSPKAGGGTKSSQPAGAGGSGGATGASSKGPCSLASTADVQAAFGGTSAAGVLNTDTPGRPDCQWSVSDSNLGGNGTASIFYTSVQTRSAFDSGKAGLPGVVNVTGVGDAAFYFPTTMSLTFAHGNTVLTVQYLATGSHPDATALQHDEATLAGTVSGHL